MTFKLTNLLFRIARLVLLEFFFFFHFLGHAWTSDYGCSDKAEEFHWLIR